MKNLKIKVYALAFISVLLFSGNTSSPDVIYWDDDKKLSWRDFQGKPKASDDYRISALTSSGIVHYRGCKDGKIIFKVRAYFEKKTSWVKEEAYNDYILAHEQLHFDVTELFARKLRKSLSERPFLCGEETAFEHYIQQFIKGWEAKQHAYDFMTRNSMDKQQQKEWERKITMELSLLEDYKE